MLKKEITYKDYNGTERTESFYFNLSQAELMEMEMSTSGGYAEMVQAIGFYLLTIDISPFSIS